MSGMSVRHKKTVSVTLEPALLQQARDAGINLSAVLTAALKEEISATGVERWKAENRAGLQEFNRITDEHGLLSDDYRTF
ncbi:antitoxin [Salmonella enterica subsp. enterica]|nr:antitoxin [Salmonella enterica subsp. enterica serovar Inganda]ECH8968281.1 antitoxin [Salmonella enterica subsp. enterica]EGC7111716.1 type II toxin-antitoxin system CcdA family antitoxin [Salmonella enterica]EBQ9782815.1 antitoxin [Salmonella enterica subsp. enterica serovar Inganda]EDU9599350.1 antitoxin [Salmonella enterica subsp. enterica]